MIVRENTEGEYSGAGGRVHQGFPIEAAMDVSLMTRAGVERIQRYGFRLAASRPRKLLTVVTKSNAQRHAMVMWDEVAAEVAKDFPEVTWDKELVDAMTARMVNRPASLDTIVATNLHADVLSDLAAALAGSLGIAPTGNINPERAFPSMFEPIHGSAFDIMGQGVANPIGTFWSVSMMLDHLGEPEAARRVMEAVEHATADPKLHTRDLGGSGYDGRSDRSGLRLYRGRGPALLGHGVSAPAASPELEERVVRKLRWRILPFVMLLYFVSFLDRVNVGFAAFTMNKALGLTPEMFGFGGGIFFAGYFLFEVPSNLILYRVGARRWIARVLISWGLVSAACAFAVGPYSFYTMRFFAGRGGGGLFPGHHLLPEPLVSGAASRGGHCRLYDGGAAFDRARVRRFPAR